MRAALLLVVTFLSGCASTAVVPRPLHQVENRVRILWEPGSGPARDLLTQALQGGGPNGQPQLVLNGRVVDAKFLADHSGQPLDLNAARAAADPLTWELDPGLRFQSAEQTGQSRAWRLEKWNLNNSFPMPVGHATIEARELDTSQTRLRVKCWDNGLLFDTRNRNRERAMLERLVDAEPK